MSDSWQDQRGKDVLVQTMVAAGSLASGVASEIIRPLRELRDHLAVMVGVLDKHITEVKGPTPLPWQETKALRERLAEAYLTSRLVTRLTGDLAHAVDTRPRPAELVEVNKMVETAVNLTRHRMAADTEVFIDFGSLPTARLNTGELVLALARLLMIAADSTRGVDGAAISITTRLEVGEAGDEVVVAVADNGAGRPEDAAGATAFLERLAGRLGGRYSGMSESGTGSFFELRWPAEKK
jgi:C4-dicarboxylate-specific signal transduction histidine kinase